MRATEPGDDGGRVSHTVNTGDTAALSPVAASTPVPHRAKHAPYPPEATVTHTPHRLRFRGPILGASLTVLLTASATAGAAPAPRDAVIVAPARTAISVSTPMGQFATANAGQSRPALSLVKLLMADYALNRGDGSARDRQLCERMIRFSDDAAADAIWAKYGPVSVSSPAAFYGLGATRPGGTWGTSWTSPRDLTRFLDVKRTTDPGSPVLDWMQRAAPVAADGTRQDWGTSRYTDVAGTKWGWSDYGPPVVGAASFGRDFSIAAITYGTAGTQTADLLAAVPDVPAAPSAVGSVEQLPVETPPQISRPLLAAELAIGAAVAGARTGSADAGRAVSGTVAGLWPPAVPAS